LFILVNQKFTVYALYIVNILRDYLDFSSAKKAKTRA